jgi:hypothetical protein
VFSHKKQFAPLNPEAPSSIPGEFSHEFQGADLGKGNTVIERGIDYNYTVKGDPEFHPQKAPHCNKEEEQDNGQDTHLSGIGPEAEKPVNGKYVKSKDEQKNGDYQSFYRCVVRSSLFVKARYKVSSCFGLKINLKSNLKSIIKLSRE